MLYMWCGHLRRKSHDQIPSLWPFRHFAGKCSLSQVACPMNVKWEIKPTNQNCLCHWLKQYWLVSMVSRFTSMGQATWNRWYAVLHPWNCTDKVTWQWLNVWVARQRMLLNIVMWELCRAITMPSNYPAYLHAWLVYRNSFRFKRDLCPCSWTRKLGMQSELLRNWFIMMLSYCCMFLCLFCWPFLNPF